jgi:ubiquinone/menaquinone biosynthesis C-methylase UbiE
MMSDREKNYWWHVGRLDILEKQIETIQKDNGDKPLSILNIGCGTGGTVAMLERHASELVNVDVSKEAIKFMKQSGYSAILVEGTSLPFNANKFDLVVAFDVLEHIEDDSSALKEWRRVLKKGGTLLITVPAHQWLWSGHDVPLQHFRLHGG